MTRIEEEFNKPDEQRDNDYIEKFILEKIKETDGWCITAQKMIAGLNVNYYLFKHVTNSISENRQSFCVDFQLGLDRIYGKDKEANYDRATGRYKTFKTK